MAAIPATTTQKASPNVDDVELRSGNLKINKGVMTFAASSDAGSQGTIRGIPSKAFISPRVTSLVYTAFGSSVNLDIGANGVNDNIVNGTAIATASNKTGIDMGLGAAALAVKRLWELAGYASDPGGTIDITFTLADANSSAGGTIVYEIGYTVD